MAKMDPIEIIAAYEQTKKISLRLILTGVGSSGLCILLQVLADHVHTMKWLIFIQLPLVVISICTLAALWFVFRCPRCGVFLGSRYRLQRKEGWQMFPPKSCWYCHISFLTGEELPHEKRKWRGMDIE